MPHQGKQECERRVKQMLTTNEQPIKRTTQGQWNAYLAVSTSKEMLEQRLSEIPEHMRADAKRHCQTVWSINKYHENRLKGKK